MDAELAITMSTEEQYKHIPIIENKQHSSQQPRQTLQGKSPPSSFPWWEASFLVQKPKDNVVWLLRKDQ